MHEALFSAGGAELPLLSFGVESEALFFQHHSRGAEKEKMAASSLSLHHAQACCMSRFSGCAKNIEFFLCIKNVYMFLSGATETHLPCHLEIESLNSDDAPACDSSQY